MRVFYSIFTKVYWKDKNAKRLICINLLLLLLIAPLIGFGGGIALFKGDQSQITLLTVFIFVFELSYSYKKIHSFMKSNELVFFKKTGMPNKILLLVLLHKQRISMILFVLACCFIYSSSYASLSIGEILLREISAILMFASIFFISFIYYRFYNRFLWLIKNCTLLCIVVVIIWQLILQFSISSGLAMQNIIRIIGNIKLFVLFHNYIALAPTFIIAILTLGLGIICFICSKKIFYIPAVLLWSWRKTSKITNNKPKLLRFSICFLKNDLYYMMKHTLYPVIQLSAVLLLIVLVTFKYYSYTLFVLIILAVFNTFFTQDMYKLDAIFINIYRKLPLSFSYYLFLRIRNISIFSTAIPFIALTIISGMGTSDTMEILFCLMLIILLPPLLVLYWSSYILCKFPYIAKSEISLIIGIASFFAVAILLFLNVPIVIRIILVLAIIVVTIIGLSKGKKRWERIIRNA
jgi:hypothetical protein